MGRVRAQTTEPFWSKNIARIAGLFESARPYRGRPASKSKIRPQSLPAGVPCRRGSPRPGRSRHRCEPAMHRDHRHSRNGGSRPRAPIPSSARPAPNARGAPRAGRWWPRCARRRATTSARIKSGSPLPPHVPRGRRRRRFFSASSCRCRYGAVEQLSRRCDDYGGPDAATLHQVAGAAVTVLQARGVGLIHRAERDHALLLAGGPARGEAAGTMQHFRLPSSHAVALSRG